MIILKQKIYTISDKEKLILEEVILENTLERGLHPQLIFYQTYMNSASGKLFIGNISKNGFWISKYRTQLFQLRPDILIFFKYNELANNKVKLRITYRLGFSSIVQCLFYSIYFGISLIGGFLLLIDVGKLNAILVSLSLFFLFYSLITSISLSSAEDLVEEHFLNKVDSIIKKPRKIIAI